MPVRQSHDIIKLLQMLDLFLAFRTAVQKLNEMVRQHLWLHFLIKELRDGFCSQDDVWQDKRINAREFEDPVEFFHPSEKPVDLVGNDHRNA